MVQVEGLRFFLVSGLGLRGVGFLGWRSGVEGY